MILVTQKPGTDRAFPWWPSFDLEPFISPGDDREQAERALWERLGKHMNPVEPVRFTQSPKYEFRLAGGADVMVNDLTLAFAHLDVPMQLAESVGYVRQTYERNRKQPWAPMHERLA